MSTLINLLYNALNSENQANLIEKRNIVKQEQQPVSATSVSSLSTNEQFFDTNSNTIIRPDTPSNFSCTSSISFDDDPDEDLDESQQKQQPSCVLLRAAAAEPSTQKKIQQSKDRQLESQRRSLKAIDKSEQLGKSIVEVRLAIICFPSLKFGTIRKYYASKQTKS